MHAPANSHKFGLRLLAGIVPISCVIAATVGAVQPPVSLPEPVAPAVKGRLPIPGPHATHSDNGKGEPNGNDKFPETGPELSLGECIAIAIERQPSLRALQASTTATEAGSRALSNIGRFGSLLSPDLSIRKQQAQSGMMAKTAEYQKLHNEVVQDVTRLYYTAVYAKQQHQLTDRVVLRMDTLVDIAKEILKNTPPKELEGFNLLKLKTMEIGLSEARKLQVNAKIGRQKALAGLREVMAVDYRTFPFQVKDKELPVMSQKAAITMDAVKEQALARRPELVLAAAGVDAFRLEVYAQGKIPFKRKVQTIASGGDIHATEIPHAQRGSEYRPGAIIPEMPTQLVGSKYDRVCRAMAFAQRAEAVYDKAYNLISLEAEVTYLDFEAASERLTIARAEFNHSKVLQDQAQASEGITKAKDQIVQAYVVAAKAQSEYIDAVYQYLLALAALERVTAGGIKPSFPDR